jgi:hypothetical protein
MELDAVKSHVRSYGQPARLGLMSGQTIDADAAVVSDHEQYVLVIENGALTHVPTHNIARIRWQEPS